MSVIVQCEACGKKFRMRDGLTQWPNCTSCQGTLQAIEPQGSPSPTPEDIFSQPVDLGSAPSPGFLPPASTPARSAKLPLILAGAGGLGLLLMVVLTIWLLSGDSEPVPPNSQVAVATDDGSQLPPTPAPAVVPEVVPAKPAPKPAPAIIPPEPQKQPVPLPAPNEQPKPNNNPRPLVPPGPPAINPIQAARKIVADPPAVGAPPGPTARLNFISPAPIFRVIRSSAPSAYFAAVVPLEKAIVIGDLTQGLRGPIITPSFSFNKERGALSADGKQLALAAQVGNHVDVVILNALDGSTRQTIPFEPSDRVVSLLFAGDDKIVVGVASNNTRGEPWIGTWNVSTGERVSLIPLPAPISDKYNPQNFNVERLAVTPGGKFVACVFRQKASLFEIATGQWAGAFQGVFQQPANADSVIAFSPDGKELAMAGGEQLPGAQIWRFDLATGQNISQSTVQIGDFKQVGSNPPKHLEYIPSLNSILLNGQFIVDYSSGRVVHSMDQFLAQPPLVAGDCVVGVTDGDNLKVVAVRLPMEQLAARIGTFNRGGTLTDSVVGEAKRGSLAGVRRLELPAADLAWSVPAIERPARTSGPKVLHLPAVFKGVGGSSSRGTYGLPIFSATGSHIAWLPYQAGAKSKLFSVDATSGKASGDIEMPPETRSLDISHDGSLIIVGSGKSRYLHAEESMERLELYFMQQQKMLLAWRVDTTNPPPPERPDPNRFTDAWFITKSQVLTRMEGGSLVLWKLPEVQAQWVLEAEKLAVVDFTPDRQIVQLNLGPRRQHAWLDVETGDWKGVLPLENEIDTSLALSPDGTRYARLSPNSQTNIWQLTLGDLPSGEQTAQFDVPYSNRIRWLDERFLLSEPTVIIDSHTGMPHCKAEGNGWRIRATDGTFWLFLDSKTDPILTRTTFPQPAILAKLRTLPAAPIKPVLGPGSRVALGNGFKTDPEAMKQHAVAFEKRGWIMDQSASLKLNFTAQQEAARTETFRDTSGRTQTVSVPGPYKTHSSITDASGKVLWKAEGSTLGSAAPSVAVLQGNETLQERVTPPPAAPEARVGNFPHTIFGTDWYPQLPVVSFLD